MADEKYRHIFGDTPGYIQLASNDYRGLFSRLITKREYNLLGFYCPTYLYNKYEILLVIIDVFTSRKCLIIKNINAIINDVLIKKVIFQKYIGKDSSLLRMEIAKLIDDKDDNVTSIESIRNLFSSSQSYITKVSDILKKITPKVYNEEYIKVFEDQKFFELDSFRNSEINNIFNDHQIFIDRIYEKNLRQDFFLILQEMTTNPQIYLKLCEISNSFNDDEKNYQKKIENNLKNLIKSTGDLIDLIIKSLNIGTVNSTLMVNAINSTSSLLNEYNPDIIYPKINIANDKYVLFKKNIYKMIENDDVQSYSSLHSLNTFILNLIKSIEKDNQPIIDLNILIKLTNQVCGNVCPLIHLLKNNISYQAILTTSEVSDYNEIIIQFSNSSQLILPLKNPDLSTFSVTDLYQILNILEKDANSEKLVPLKCSIIKKIAVLKNS